MQISYNGVNLLKDLEGFRDEAYLDTGGVWTIGYGSTRVDGRPVKQGDKITESKATEALASDIAWAQTCINQNVQVALTQNMFDALVSFVYNVGAGAFQKSTMLRMLNMKLYGNAGLEFPRWNKDNGKEIQGLTNRRLKEQVLFQTK